jgi:hypothetical protein
MKERQVARILQGIAEDEIPATLDLWPAIRAQVQPRRPSSQRVPSRRARLVPATRLGWAFLALALALASGAVAYAVAPALSRVFQMEAGLQHIEQADLIQELDLSQTVDGLTVTLERAYADANRIVVGFTIKDLNGQRYEARHLALTDAAGTVFPETVGYGVSGQSDILKVSLPPGEGAYVLAFDAGTVTGAPEALDLRLVMELEELVLPPDTPSPSPTLASSPAEPPEPVVVELVPMPEGTIVGPFTFDFSVPFIPGRTVEVHQTVQAAGVAITLEEMTVAPSETRAILCFDPPDRGSKEWFLITAGDGQDLAGGAVSRFSRTGEECHRVIYLGALAGRSGLWTLTVTELVGFDLAQPWGQTRLAGPWVFYFRAP